MLTAAAGFQDQRPFVGMGSFPLLERIMGHFDYAAAVSIFIRGIMIATGKRYLSHFLFLLLFFLALPAN